MSPQLWRRLSDVLLSSDPQQKKLGQRFLIGLVNCAAGIAVLNYGAQQGFVDALQCQRITWASVVAGFIFFVLHRSAWNKRCSDPSLAEPQMLCAIGFLAWGYLIGGPSSPVALMLLFIVLMFGMFTTTTRQLIRASIFTACLFTAAFWITAVRQDAGPTTAHMQMVYLGVLLIMLISVCILVHEMTKMRISLIQSRADLGSALAHIKELATRDELTGLFNRRHMLSVLNAEGQRIDRNQGKFSLCLVDVDHFKSINDRWGHNTGDEVLSSIANVIAAGLRETDVVARWGGEEFLILFTDTDCEAASQVIDRIRHTLSLTTVSSAHPTLRVTFSAGMSTYQVDEAMMATIERADQALYQAKATGRNRTERHGL